VNEKGNFCLAIILVIIVFFFGGAIGFFAGGGDLVRYSELKHANRKLAATAGELRSELGRERTITQGLRSKQDEERNLIRGALGACRSAGDGIQGIIAKMEILNGLIHELERRADRSADISGSE